MDTLEEVKLILKDLAISQAKNEKEFEKTKKILDDLALAQKETDKQLKDLALTQKKTQEEIGFVSQSTGDSLEQSFFYSLKDSLFLDNVKYDTIELNKDFVYIESEKLKSKEFDIILFNCETIAVIEIKKNPKKKDLINLANSMNTIKLCFSHLKIKEIKLYLGFSNLSKDKENKNNLINLSKKHNIKLLTLKGDIVEVLENKEI